MSPNPQETVDLINFKFIVGCFNSRSILKREAKGLNAQLKFMDSFHQIRMIYLKLISVLPSEAFHP